jgi:hypothetical protein
MVAVVLAGSLLTVLSGGRAAANDVLSADWLNSTVTPAIGKVADLPNDQEPFSMGADCIPADFPTGPKNNGQVVHGCEFPSALGTTTDSYVVKGPDGTLQTTGSAASPYIYLLPAPTGDAEVLVSRFHPSSWDSGIEVSFSSLASGPTETSMGYMPVRHYYSYTTRDTKVLSDVNGAAYHIMDGSIAYSQNGDWAVFVVMHKGIVLFDLKKWQGKLIDASTIVSGTVTHETKGVNLAVSNDGQFVALNNPTSDGKPTLFVYDTTTCKDQSDRSASLSNGCEYKDVWNGMYRGKLTGTAIKDQVGAEYPRHIRFAGDSLLQFDSVHDRTDAQHFEVSRYAAVVSESVHERYLSLLGMGDSYISGEGARVYLDDTDTANNKCHNSWLSYPVSTGRTYFPQVRNVACSGAKINDVDAGVSLLGGAVDTARSNYEGQVKNKESWSNRETSTQLQVMGSFIPGYADQILFSNEYEPRITLLSIGGNDIHFADIVSQCVSPQNSDTCYATREDREELMEQIIAQYYRLVALYKDVAASSGGNVYVIGYPQIAKPGGNCGSNVLMNNDEVQFSADLIAYLNSVISRAAASAGVYYVDTQKALTGYRLCEAAKGHAAMNGFTTGKDSGLGTGAVRFNFIGQESYHPTAFGYKLIGETIAAKTYDFTAPMPTPTNKPAPTVDLNSPLLTNVPATRRTLNMLIWRDPLFYNPFTTGEALVLDTVREGLAYGSNYTLQLHSTPVVLSQGKVGSGQIAVTIPIDTPAGIHTLDLYGTDDQGRAVDVRQVVYIGTLADLQEPCLNMPLSGSDEDGDGIDDTCDAGYFDPSLVPYLNDTPPEQGVFTGDDALPTDSTDGTNDILVALKSAGTSSSETTSVPSASGQKSAGKPSVAVKAINSVPLQLFANKSTSSVIGSVATAPAGETLGVNNILYSQNVPRKSAKRAGSATWVTAIAGGLLVVVLLLRFYKKTAR